MLDAINLVSGDCDMFNQNDVKSATASLCVNKACGMDSLSTEHLLYASPEIHTLLAICFNAFIVHVFLPSFLTDSVIIPTRQVTRATHVRNRICPRVKLIIKIIIILLIIFLGFIKSKSC